MALIDDINALPATVAGGNTGHTGNHQTIHAGLKSHETRLGTVEGKIPAGTELKLDTTVGTRITAGSTVIHGDTGWRSITSLLAPAPNSGSLRIRRTKDSVHLHFSYLLFNSGVTSVGKIPRAWWTGASTTVPITDNHGNKCGSMEVTYSGDVTLLWESTRAGVGMAVLPTTEAWPTEIIGS